MQLRRDMDENRPSRLAPVLALLLLIPSCVGSVSVDGSGDDSDDPSGPEVTFRPTVLEDMNTAGCTTSSCHGGGVVPMQLTPFPTTEAQWLANYEEVRTRANALLIPKATDDSHPSSRDAADPMILRWQLWIDDGLAFEAEEEAADGGVGPDADTTPPGDGGIMPESVSWNGIIGSIMLTDGCTSCHGQSGAYSLQTYQAALGFGSGDSTPNVIPGNASSKLITYCESNHKGGMPQANQDLVRQWIVDFDAVEQ